MTRALFAYKKEWVTTIYSPVLGHHEGILSPSFKWEGIIHNLQLCYWGQLFSHGRGTSLDALRVVNERRGEQAKTLKNFYSYTSRALEALKYHSISRTFKISYSDKNGSSRGLGAVLSMSLFTSMGRQEWRQELWNLIAQALAVLLWVTNLSGTQFLCLYYLVLLLLLLICLTFPPILW